LQCADAWLRIGTEFSFEASTGDATMNTTKLHSERRFWKDADGVRTHRTITDEDTDNGPVVTVDNGITDYRGSQPRFSNQRSPRERNTRKEAEDWFNELCEQAIKDGFKELAVGESWPVV
jgi:hypothetical protein